jgi:hypothetical protein
VLTICGRYRYDLRAVSFADTGILLAEILRANDAAFFMADLQSSKDGSNNGEETD